MTKTWKWLSKELGLIEVQPTKTKDVVWEMQLDTEGIAYFNADGCKCDMVPLPELHQLIVSGQDDCPVHGIQGGNDEENRTNYYA